MIKKALFLTFCLLTSGLCAGEQSSRGRYQMRIIGEEREISGHLIYVLDTQTGIIWRGQTKFPSWGTSIFEWTQLPSFPVSVQESE